jgi:AbiU2
MKNPKTQLHEYLGTLIHRFLNTKSLYQELKRIYGWKTPKRFEAYNLGTYFFELAEYSLLRIVLVEMSMLLSKNEERSLIDWLRKAREHAPSLRPTHYNPSYSASDRQPINEKEYRALIDSHKSRLDAQQHVIDRIKAHRDKAIAHFDSAYFNNPKALNKYPLTYSDIDRLMDVVSEILRKHHSCLSKADLRMEILSTRNVDLVLNYARAFQRARKDRALIKKGFKPVAYLRDEYEGDK